MNQHATFTPIGDDSAAMHNAPALRRRLSEIVAEYDEKSEAIPAAIEAFNEATTAINFAACIGGAYGGRIFSKEPSLYERDVRKSLLRSAWRHVHNGLNIDAIASAKDRGRLEMMLENPEPFTLENIKAAYGDYLLDPRFHILKGLAECFCDLDPAYKSHSRVKIGVEGLPKRIIVTSAIGWNSWGRERVKDTLNALRAYRGQPRFTNGDFADVMSKVEKLGEVELDAGRIRIFKNGNAHLLFDELALIDINRALAEFYGAVLPDAPSEAEAKRPSTEVARELQFYPTPAAVADIVVNALGLRGADAVLEPSCGDGRLMDALIRWEKSNNLRNRDALRITGVEYDAARAELARAKGHSVMTANFLQVAPDPRFDAVVMNPPFYGQHYKKHLDHALRFLRPGGRLVCILPASAHYDHDNAPGTWTDLPVGSFASSGTNMPTGYCRVVKARD